MEILIAVISSIGLGSILTTLFNNFLDKRKIKNEKKDLIKIDLYKNLLIFMNIALDIDNKKYYQLYELQHTLQTKDEYIKQISLYYYDAILYCPDKVLKNLHDFIEKPSKTLLAKTALQMRSDLWGGKTNLTYMDTIHDKVND